jgi:hypothetical protein
MLCATAFFDQINHITAAESVCRNWWLHNWLRNCLPFIEPKGHYHVQEPVIETYHQPFVWTLLCLLQTILILSFHLTLDPPDGFFTSGFLANIWSPCVLLYMYVAPLKARQQTVQP